VKGSHHACATTKLTLFSASKDEWHTKEDAGKSIKNALTYCGMPKGIFQAEVTSNSEKIELVALAIVE